MREPPPDFHVGCTFNLQPHPSRPSRNSSCHRHGAATPDKKHRGGQAPCRCQLHGSPTREVLLKSRASNRAGATTTGAGGCNPLLRPIPDAGVLGVEVARNGSVLGDKDTASRRQCLDDLIQVKAGESPATGRLVRVEQLHHRKAAEAVEIRQGAEGKPGSVGTERGNP